MTAGFTVQQIDSGLLDLAFGGRVRAAAEAPRDAGSVSLIFLDAAGNELRRQDVEALNTADRWELVGARVTAPVGARFAVLRFAADRNSGSSDDVWFDTGFVYQVADSYVANLGAYGAGTHEPATTTAPRIELRFPDMYTDWEKNEPVAIRWETLNNLANSPVRIDLLQDTADGPRLVTNIVASTPDDGNFIWIPANSGIDFGTKGLRIQVSLVNAPAVIDRSQETFSVPEDGQNYYVDDQSNVGDAYTPGAVGDNRNTGKTAATPKPNPVNVFRAYDLKAGDTLYIDTGDYPMIDPIAVSGTVDVSLVAGPGMGRDEGFTITGPADTSLIAKLFPAIPRPQPGFDRLERRRLRQRQPFDLAKCPARPVRSRRLRQFQRQLPDRQRPRPAGYFYRHRLAVRRSGPSGQLQQPGRRRRGQRQHPRADQFRGLCQYRRRFQRQRRYRNGQRKHRLQQQRLGFEFSQPGAAAIVRNQSYNNRAGIHVSNSSAGIARIGDDDLAAGNGNLVYNNRDGGIYAYYGALVAGNTVYGHLTSGAWGIYGYSNVTTRSNVVYGNTQGIYAWFGSVETNRVYANSADGVRTENSDVVGNVIYSNAVGLRVGQNYNTPRTGRNNLIYANSQAGALLSGDRFTFINNTVVQPLGDALRVSDASNTGVFNNIIGADTGYTISVASNSQVGFQADYNLFLPRSSGVFGQWQGIDRANLTSWRSASFTDATVWWPTRISPTPMVPTTNWVMSMSLKTAATTISTKAALTAALPAVAVWRRCVARRPICRS